MATVPSPPAAEVTLWRVLRIAGLLLALGPVVLAGLGLAAWIVWQIALWAFLVAGGL